MIDCVAERSRGKSIIIDKGECDPPWAPFIVDLTALKWSLFEIFDVPTNHNEADHLR